jgi:hypothetical protein
MQPSERKMRLDFTLGFLGGAVGVLIVLFPPSAVSGVVFWCCVLVGLLIYPAVHLAQWIFGELPSSIPGSRHLKWSAVPIVVSVGVVIAYINWPVWKDLFLHVNSVAINVKADQPIGGTVMAVNEGSKTIVSPDYTAVVAIVDNPLSAIGEQHLFEMADRSTLSSINRPGLEIEPQHSYSFPLYPTDGTQGRKVSTEQAAGIEAGTKNLYILLILQYGPQLRELLPDGLRRPHSVFCVHYTHKGEEPYYCNGFNYRQPN